MTEIGRGNDREGVRNDITTVIPECIYRESRPIFISIIKKEDSQEAKYRYIPSG